MGRSRCATLSSSDWQTLALVPGVSRSGITLAVGMAIGLRRDAAAASRFCCRFRRWLLALSSSFPSCCTITTWEFRPCSLAWPLLACQISVAFDGSALPPNKNHVLLRHLPVALGLSLLPLFSRGSWREARPYHYDGHPSVGFPPTCPARFAARRGHDLLRLSPQGPTPTWTGQVGIGISVLVDKNLFARLAHSSAVRAALITARSTGYRHQVGPTRTTQPPTVFFHLQQRTARRETQEAIQLRDQL